MPNPKSIRIFLADGVPNGLMIAEMGGRTGTFLVVPRTSNLIQVLKARPETGQPGIYFLVGIDDNSAVYREKVYIGESDDVLTRLSQHLKSPDKDFWRQTILIVSKDPTFNKIHAKYLENRMISITQAAGRASLANGNAGSTPYMSVADKADMENFLEEIQIVLPTLGFSFALPAPVVITKPPAPTVTPPSPTPGSGPSVISNSPLFVFNGSGVTAQAQEINGEFVVSRGSHAKAAAQSLKGSYKSLRDQLLQDNKLVPDTQTGELLFTADVPFNSTSAAATIIVGHAKNGPDAWKIQSTGQTYKDWQNNQSAQALNQAPPSPVPVNPPTQPPATPGPSLPTQPLVPGPNSPVFVLTLGALVAEAQEINGQFVVLKGSGARKNDSPALPGYHQKTRAQFVAGGKLAPDPQTGELIFTEDVPFKSPSGAGVAISGFSISGPLHWKVKGTNQSYADWQATQSSQAFHFTPPSPPNPGSNPPTISTDPSLPALTLAASGGNSPTFILSTGSVVAQAQKINGQFVVLKGSGAYKDDSPSLPSYDRKTRAQLLAEGKLAADLQNGELVFTQNVSFNSPSSAGAAICGYKVSGPQYWKVKGTNQTYGDWQAAQVQNSSSNNFTGSN